MRQTYFNGKENELEKVKYAIRVDNLIEHKSRSKDKVIRKIIPYRLILLGRKIMIKKNKELVEVNIEQFISCFYESLEHEQENLDSCAKEIPYHFYDFVKVCDRCYEVYTLFGPPKIKINVVPELKFENKNKTSPVKSIMASRRSSSSTRLKSPRKNSVFSTSNKDNLDDLLDDIGNTLFEIKHGEKNLRLKMADSLSRTFSRQQLKTNVEKQKVQLEMVKAEVFDHDAMTHQLFPDAKYFMKIKPTGKDRHDQYLKKLKDMSFSRGKLHHFRESIVKKLK